MLPGIRQIPPDLKPSPPIASSPPAAHNDFLLLTAVLQAASSKRFIFSHNCFMSVLLSVSYMLFHDNHGTGWIVTISYFYKRICPHDLYRPTSSGILGLPDTSTQTKKCVNPDVYALFCLLKSLIFKAPGRTRTGDPRITNALRYQLRYGSTREIPLPAVTLAAVVHKKACQKPLFGYLGNKMLWTFIQSTE